MIELKGHVGSVDNDEIVVKVGNEGWIFFPPKKVKKSADKMNILVRATVNKRMQKKLKKVLK